MKSVDRSIAHPENALTITGKERVQRNAAQPVETSPKLIASLEDVILRGAVVSSEGFDGLGMGQEEDGQVAFADACDPVVGWDAASAQSPFVRNESQDHDSRSAQRKLDRQSGDLTAASRADENDLKVRTFIFKPVSRLNECGVRLTFRSLRPHRRILKE